MGDDKVKNFVRNTLGCDCSEDVFGHIENERNVESGGVTIKNKINVGNRLLVYVVEADTDILKEMPVLISMGMRERDGRNFNRFRLVLISDDKKLKKAAYKAFGTLPEMDEKVHLHVIENNEMADL